MYVLLTGKRPFYKGKEGEKQLLAKTQSLHLFQDPKSSPYYNVYYSEAKDLMFKLCNPNVLGRYTAKEALRHPWITK